jgi:hypothetical protein
MEAIQIARVGTSSGERVVGRVGGKVDATRAANANETTRRATMSTTPYKAPPAPVVRPDTMCKANDDTCGARRKKGEDFCVGHLRSMGMLDGIVAGDG